MVQVWCKYGPYGQTMSDGYVTMWMCPKLCKHGQIVSNSCMPLRYRGCQIEDVENDLEIYRSMLRTLCSLSSAFALISVKSTSWRGSSNFQAQCSILPLGFLSAWLAHFKPKAREVLCAIRIYTDLYGSMRYLYGSIRYLIHVYRVAYLACCDWPEAQRLRVSLGICIDRTRYG